MTPLHSTIAATVVLGGVTLAGLGAAVPPPSPAAGAGQDQAIIETDDGAMRRAFVITQDVEALHDADGTVRSESIMMRMNSDGDLGVWVDGDQIDASHMRSRDGRIEILDEHGNVTRELELEVRRGDLPFGWRFRFGDDDDVLLRGLEGSEEQPTVMIGVHVGAPGPALEHHLGLTASASTMITAVYKGLPAHEAGLGQFDIVTAIDGVEPCPPETFGRLLAGHEPGQTLRLAVISEGMPNHVDVTLESYSAERLAAAEVIGQAPSRAFSLSGVLAPAGATFEPDAAAFGPGTLGNLFIDDQQRVFEVPGTGIGLAWEQRMQALDARIEEMRRLLLEVGPEK